MSLTVEIVTPDRRAFEGAADKVTLPTALGSIGILPGHQPITAIIAAGEVVVTLDGKVSRLAIDQGFVRVVSDKVSVVTEAAIDEAKIDLKAVETAEARARAQAPRPFSFEAGGPGFSRSALDTKRIGR